MAQFLTTDERRQVFVDRDVLLRDWGRTAFTLPRAGKDFIGTYRPTYGMAE